MVGFTTAIAMAARVKARMKLIRKTDDDDFQILEILAAPPLQ